MNEIKLGKELIFSNGAKRTMYYVYHLSDSSTLRFKSESERSKYISENQFIINLKTKNYA